MLLQGMQTKICLKRHAKSLLFGVAFDQPHSDSESSLFQNKQSASLEGKWEADCGRPNPMDAYEQKVVALRHQPLIQPSLVPVRPGPQYEPERMS